jgi:hypothetical protein
MLIKNTEKLRKTTLRERIYKEVVHLILSGELPRGGWVDEKQVIDKLRVSRTPFREAIAILAIYWNPPNCCGDGYRACSREGEPPLYRRARVSSHQKRLIRTAEMCGV